MAGAPTTIEADALRPWSILRATEATTGYDETPWSVLTDHGVIAT
ncbi:MAG: hypothetical protein R6W93_12670 [Candidatus Limnocylindrales bacterium]